jgi:hypothetical protein
MPVPVVWFPWIVLARHTRPRGPRSPSAFNFVSDQFVAQRDRAAGGLHPLITRTAPESARLAPSSEAKAGGLRLEHRQPARRLAVLLMPASRREHAPHWGKDPIERFLPGDRPHCRSSLCPSRSAAVYCPSRRIGLSHQHASTYQGASGGQSRWRTSIPKTASTPLSGHPTGTIVHSRHTITFTAAVARLSAIHRLTLWNAVRLWSRFRRVPAVSWRFGTPVIIGPC